MKKEIVNHKVYQELLEEIIQQIELHKVKAAREINITIMHLYDTIGKSIVDRQALQGWGKSVVEQLSKDLYQNQGKTESYSPRNLWYMRQYHLTYVKNDELRQLSYQVPWGQNILVLSKVKEVKAKKYYLQKTIEAAWSRKTLLNAIKADTYHHHQLAPKRHNFKETLPSHFSEQADEMLKSEYALDFLDVEGPILERQLENRIIARIKEFILELGYGFSYIGNQYKLNLNNKEYFVDLLFFHRKLKCLVAIDLKIGEFQPEFAGKMNFYLNLLNKQVKLEQEYPSIGIILCAEKDHVEVEYALAGIQNPIGVAEYRLEKKLPAKLKGELPGVKELKQKLKSELKKSGEDA